MPNKINNLTVRANRFLDHILAQSKPENIILDQLNDFIKELNTTLVRHARNNKLAITAHFDLNSEITQQGKTAKIVLTKESTDPSENGLHSHLLKLSIHSEIDYQKGTTCTFF